jgi:hypothetical protein
LRPKAIKQQGQAAVEFIFAIVMLVTIAAVLFQALHFELDVFNKTMVARYELLRKARVNEISKERGPISQQIVGKWIDDVVPYRVPFQPDNLNIRYGPKYIHTECGTKYTFPLPEGLYDGGLIALLVLDLYESTAGNIGTVFGPIESVTSALGALCD